MTQLRFQEKKPNRALVLTRRYIIGAIPVALGSALYYKSQQQEVDLTMPFIMYIGAIILYHITCSVMEEEEKKREKRRKQNNVQVM